MKCYLILYDLRSSDRNYSSLTEAIKSYGTWAKITENSWAIVTDHSAVDIRNNLTQFIDSEDRLFVIKSGSHAAWKNVLGKTDWFKKYLKLT